MASFFKQIARPFKKTAKEVKRGISQTSGKVEEELRRVNRQSFRASGLPVRSDIRQAGKLSDLQEAERIAIGPRASAVSRGALLDVARQRSAEKLKKRRRGGSAATIGFNLGTANIGTAALGA